MYFQVYRELNFCVGLQSTEVSDYRGCFLHENVGKWHFGWIREDAGARLKRFWLYYLAHSVVYQS